MEAEAAGRVGPPVSVLLDSVILIDQIGHTRTFFALAMPLVPALKFVVSNLYQPPLAIFWFTSTRFVPAGSMISIGVFVARLLDATHQA